jgi:hypothetical protein
MTQGQWDTCSGCVTESASHAKWAHHESAPVPGPAPPTRTYTHKDFNQAATAFAHLVRRGSAVKAAPTEGLLPLFPLQFAASSDMVSCLLPTKAPQGAPRRDRAPFVPACSRPSPPSTSLRASSGTRAWRRAPRRMHGARWLKPWRRMRSTWPRVMGCTHALTAQQARILAPLSPSCFQGGVRHCVVFQGRSGKGVLAWVDCLAVLRGRC